MKKENNDWKERNYNFKRDHRCHHIGKSKQIEVGSGKEYIFPRSTWAQGHLMFT